MSGASTRQPSRPDRDRYAKDCSLNLEARHAVLKPELLERLKSFDTPTICNALEVIDPSLRLTGFTTRPLVAPFPDLPPMVGYARTASIRSTHAHERAGQDARDQRIGYYEYVASASGPQIVVIQDLDGPDVGFGAFWGEVQSTVHKALGCVGVVTDGCIRDIPQWAPGLNVLAGSIAPSHAHVHLADYGREVRVAGMVVRSGDLVHADRHGAVVIPAALVDKAQGGRHSRQGSQARLHDRDAEGGAREAGRDPLIACRGRGPATAARPEVVSTHTLRTGSQCAAAGAAEPGLRISMANSARLANRMLSTRKTSAKDRTLACVRTMNASCFNAVRSPSGIDCDILCVISARRSSATGRPHATLSCRRTRCRSSRLLSNVLIRARPTAPPRLRVRL